MSLFLILCWVIGVSSFTLLGSLYVRRYDKPDLLIGLYVAFVLTAQLLATKVSVFDLGALGSMSGPAGILVFSVTFLILDIVNERFGRKETRRMIFIAFIAQMAPVFFVWLAAHFDPAQSAQSNAVGWDDLLVATPRITLASWLAFLVSENFDVSIYSWFKKMTGDKHLWMRNVFSTLPALLVDSLIFVPIAFWGTPLPVMLLLFKSQVLIKWIVGVANIPFIYLNHAVIVRGRETPDRRLWGFSGGTSEQ